MSQQESNPTGYRHCSLWEAFDKLQLCTTISPQMKNYYRYGELRDCRLEREDFSFCWNVRYKNAKEQHVNTTID